MFVKSIGISDEELGSKTIFFKTIGAVKWEELTDLTYMFTELTSEIIVFLAYIDASEAENFRKAHCKMAKDITEINLGDAMVYKDNQN